MGLSFLGLALGEGDLLLPECPRGAAGPSPSGEEASERRLLRRLEECRSFFSPRPGLRGRDLMFGFSLSSRLKERSRFLFGTEGASALEGEETLPSFPLEEGSPDCPASSPPAIFKGGAQTILEVRLPRRLFTLSTAKSKSAGPNLS